MIQNKREIIESEIDSLKRAVDKYTKDHSIITGMIDGLINDRNAMTKEVIALRKMIDDRTEALEDMSDKDMAGLNE